MLAVDLPDDILFLIRDFNLRRFPQDPPLATSPLEQHLTFSQVCTRFRAVCNEPSWRTCLFHLNAGRSMANVPSKLPTWKDLAVIFLKHGKTCHRAGCKETLYPEHQSLSMRRIVDTLTSADVFRFHKLHFTIHGNPQTIPLPAEPAPQPASGRDTQVYPAPNNSPAYTITVSRVLGAHLPFPKHPGRAEHELFQYGQQYGPTQRYTPLCRHPNASSVFATMPPARQLRLPFRINGETLIIDVTNDTGVTLLDLSRALINALLAEPDDIAYNTVMETYGARDDMVSFGLVQVLRDRGYMNDHEWPLIELLDEYDYGESSWDGYTSWVDNVRGS